MLRVISGPPGTYLYSVYSIIEKPKNQPFSPPTSEKKRRIAKRAKKRAGGTRSPAPLRKLRFSHEINIIYQSFPPKTSPAVFHGKSSARRYPRRASFFTVLSQTPAPRRCEGGRLRTLRGDQRIICSVFTDAYTQQISLVIKRFVIIPSRDRESMESEEVRHPRGVLPGNANTYTKCRTVPNRDRPVRNNCNRRRIRRDNIDLCMNS